MQSDQTKSAPATSAWPRVRLESVATKIRSGATPRGGSENYLPTRQQYVLIRSQNVLDHHFTRTGLANITDDQASELAGAEVQSGDVLLNITGDGVTFGRSCIVPDGVLPACVNQHVMLIRLNQKRCLPGYMLAWLTQPDTKAYIESFNAGGSRRAITKGHIESFALPLPPLPAQKAIADLTILFNNRIEMLAAANERIEAIANTVFRSWFIDFDPVRIKEGGGTPASMSAEVASLFPANLTAGPSGSIPSGWTWSRLDAVCNNVRVQANPANLPTDTAYVGLEHMPRKSLSLFDRGTSEALESNKFWFEANDILFGKLRPYFHKVALAPWRGVCSTDILVLRAKGADTHAFATMHASSDEVIAYTTRLSNGARMPRASWNDLAAYPIALPPAAILKAFNETITPMFARMAGNIALARNLSALRDSLLQRMVCGQLAIPAETHDQEEATA